MKVICAGMLKTGTKSMQVALRKLGFNVYDFMENYEYLRDDWEKIFTEGGSTEDFRRMFENVDAVTDIPGCYFWDEIHKAFPDSKIVFCTKESEEAWMTSMNNQIIAMSNPALIFLVFLSPTLWRIDRYNSKLFYSVFGTKIAALPFQTPSVNRLLLRMTYRRHNAHVMQNAPKDKLLIYNVKQGWDPLCKFLELKVPSTPFPHKNIKGNIMEEFLEQHPIFIRAKREAAISLTLLAFVLVYGVHKLSRSSLSTWYGAICNSIQSLWK